MIRHPLALLLMLCVCVSFLYPHPAAASSAQAECVLDGQPTPSQIELRCDFSGAGVLHDRLTISNSQGRLGDPQAGGWADAVMLVDELWLFDAGADGQVELAIDFTRRGSTLVAQVYDMAGAATGLPVVQGSAGLELGPGLHPTVTVTAPDGWWMRDGLINYNLDMTVDGAVGAAFDVRERIAPYVALDGVPEFTIRVRDRNGNGHPDYDWRTIHFGADPPPVARVIPRTYLMVNVRDDEPLIAPAFPWPLIGQLSYGYLSSSPRPVYDPPIQVDWAQGRVIAVSEMVASRANDGQWFVYSFAEVRPDSKVIPDFESPFAWYDLADDHDRQPELAIRFSHYPAGDRVFLEGQHPRPVTAVRYSWDQNNDGFWDYKLGLLNDSAITTTVAIDDLAMTLAPYASLPAQVVSQSWGPASFVAAETEALGEGIYVWDIPAWLMQGYFAGRSSSPEPTQPTRELFGEVGSISPGFRGDYTYALAGPVRLYWSPVDHKLHLRHATGGRWQIDARLLVTYADRDGDGMVDQWQVREGEPQPMAPLVGGQVIGVQTVDPSVPVSSTLLRQLNVAPGYLLYSGDGEVIVRQASVPASPLEVAPPDSTTAWQALQSKLETLAPAPGAVNLREMQGQFPGPEQHLSNATISDYQSQGATGYSFVLTLQEGAQSSGEALLDLQGRGVGRYRVVYDGAFMLTPLPDSPPVLTLQLPEHMIAGQPTRLLFNVDNQGQPARSLTLVLASGQSGQMVEQLRQQLTAPGDSTITLVADWTPLGDGQRDLRVWLEEDGQLRAETTRSILIDQGAGVGRVPGDSGGQTAALVALPILLLAALGVGFAAAQRRSEVEL